MTISTDSEAATRGAAPGAGVTDEELQALRAATEAGLPAFLDDLLRLCSIDCGSYTPKGVNEVGDWVAHELAQLGASIERRPDPNGRFGDTIIATIRGRPGAGPRLLLIGHMDTVFEAGTVAKRPPTIVGSIAKGPGVSDMKAGLIAGIRALGALRDLAAAAASAGTGAGGGQSGQSGGSGGTLADLPFERIIFVANPDEEVGSPSSTPHIVEIARDTDACFVLECARASGDFVSARKGMADLRISVYGKAAHAGVEPEKGRSAILAGAELVREIHALNGRWPDVTANVGVFKAGTRPNIVCDEAELQVDIRAMAAGPLKSVLDAVNELVLDPSVPGCTASVETMHSWAPMEKLERSGRLAETVISLASRLGFATKDVSTGGASDANTTSGMGVPTIDGLGPIGGMDHSPEEYLEIDSIAPRTALLAALLLATGRDPVVASWRQG